MSVYILSFDFDVVVSAALDQLDRPRALKIPIEQDGDEDIPPFYDELLSQSIAFRAGDCIGNADGGKVATR